MRLLNVQDLGNAPYAAVHQLQLEILKRKKENANETDVLLLVEHPEVYTFGRKSKDPIPAHLPNAFAVERGGEVTYHNPGQLVFYPILALKGKEQDVHKYLRRLEQITITTLKRFNLNTGRREGATGVWVDGKEKKIASIGVAVSSWITYHGVALNVSNDLTGFSKINPCGYSSSVMTSMRHELGEACPTLERAKETLREIFTETFECRLTH